jgi:hypothetical protein
VARVVTTDLTWEICDLWGAPINDGAIIEHIAGATIDRALNDQAATDVTVDIYHPVGNVVAKPYGALTRIVKAYYAPTKATKPIFTGVLLEPHWIGGDETLELSAVDVVFRLQHAFLATAYSTPSGGKDIGAVMWDIIGRAANRPYPVGSPGLGVIFGSVAGTYNIDREWAAGENCWDILQELSQLAGAPDMLFDPLDRTDGALWEFYALAPGGTDVSSTVLFEYNTGLSNCANMEYVPSGTPVENYYSAMGQPPDDGSLANPIGYARHDASIAARGLYEGWDSNDATDIAVERAKAGEQVAAYHEPPDFITVVPNPEGPGYPTLGIPPRYGIDYDIGYEVHAVGRKGTMKVDEGARVQTASLAENDRTGSVSITLELAPNVDGAGTATF